jgi:nucleotide-binding universal stress UspA family protein
VHPRRLEHRRHAVGNEQFVSRRLIVYKRIVLAYDGSESGQRALLDCQEIGQWSQAQLHLVAVMAPPMGMVAVDAWAYSPTNDSEEKAHYQSVLDLGVNRLRQSGLEVHGEVVIGNSVDEIVRVANTVRAELIVLGHKHLESWAARWWRGSVSKSLIEFAPCSVLIVITP